MAAGAGWRKVARLIGDGPEENLVEWRRRRRVDGTRSLGFRVSLYITSEFWIGVFGPSDLNRMA